MSFSTPSFEFGGRISCQSTNKMNNGGVVKVCVFFFNISISVSRPRISVSVMTSTLPILHYWHILSSHYSLIQITCHHLSFLPLSLFYLSRRSPLAKIRQVNIIRSTIDLLNIPTSTQLHHSMWSIITGHTSGQTSRQTK